MKNVMLSTYNKPFDTSGINNLTDCYLLLGADCSNEIILNNYIQVLCKKNQPDLNYQNKTLIHNSKQLINSCGFSIPKDIPGANSPFLLNSIQSFLQNGHYCVCHVNSNLLPPEKVISKSDEKILIYGFASMGETCYYIKTFDNDFQIVDLMLSESQLMECMEATGEKNYLLFYLTINERYREHVNIQEILRKISSYIHSDGCDGGELYGQKAFYEIIRLMDQNLVCMRLPLILLEHKKLMYKRVDYLVQSANIGSSTLTKAYETVVKRAQTVFDMSLEYSKTRKASLIKMLQGQIRTVLETEKEILQEVIGCRY